MREKLYKFEMCDLVQLFALKNTVAIIKIGNQHIHHHYSLKKSLGSRKC